MLYIDLNLPERALIYSKKTSNNISKINDSGLWFRGDKTSIIQSKTGAITEWRTTDGLFKAKSVKSNFGDVKLDNQTIGITQKAGHNSGLILSNITKNLKSFSFVIHFHSTTGDARTLLTLNPREHDNYLFLSQKDGNLSLQDQKSQILLQIPSEKRSLKAEQYVAFGYSNNILYLASWDHDLKHPIISSTETSEIGSSLKGTTDLFIACRSHRKGITKTLGQSIIFNVFAWPHQNWFTTGTKGISNIEKYLQSRKDVTTL